jgi:hypothetical protein
MQPPVSNTSRRHRWRELIGLLLTSSGIVGLFLYFLQVIG